MWQIADALRSVLNCQSARDVKSEQQVEAPVYQWQLDITTQWQECVQALQSQQVKGVKGSAMFSSTRAALF